MKYICSLIAVRDIKISRNFYENLLNQKVEFDFGENVSFAGGFAIHLADHFQSLLGLSQNASTISYKTHNFELYFESDDMDGIYHILKENNVEFIHEIREQPWGQRVCRFYDPDYHIIEVGESMERVVLRYHQTGMSVEDISRRTSLPVGFVENVVSG
ncbi:MAG: VOC family protein [Bacillota bacterium]|jgi:catechol 2,3-dioxygenase-like lactoylglutathione lyase family enzyme